MRFFLDEFFLDEFFSGWALFFWMKMTDVVYWSSRMRDNDEENEAKLGKFLFLPQLSK
jgi:hypothetical protein